jgi:hypothetical protein
MPDLEKLNKLLQTYSFIDRVYNKLSDLITPDGNMEEALSKQRLTGRNYIEMNINKAVAVVNYEYSLNGNSFAYHALHSYLVKTKGKTALAKCIDYSIENNEMVFHTAKPLKYFKNGCDVIEYFSDLAKYKPLLFQYFLISAIKFNEHEISN